MTRAVASNAVDSAAIRAFIREVADFPEPGVLFKDITPMLADPVAFRSSIDLMTHGFADTDIDLVVGIEARGFVLAAPIASSLGAGMVPIRKPGKLPFSTDQVTYALEYGIGSLEIHTDAISPGSRVLIVDDVLATGGTAAAAVELVQRQGGDVVGLSFLVELGFLGGRGKLLDAPPVHSVLIYD